MSFSEISQATKTMLLLTGRFGGARQRQLTDRDVAFPLTTRELNKLVDCLTTRAIGIEELIAPGSDAKLPELVGGLDSSRLHGLLGRGFKMALAVEQWQQRGIWVLSREDEHYPQVLIKRLTERAPPIIYGCGHVGIFDCDGLAIQGSRNAGNEALAYTHTVGMQAVEAGFTVVSGGAKGVDQAAMTGALDAGGNAIAVLSNGLSRAVVSSENRIPVMEDRLLLISPFDPDSGFSVGKAMGRNKLIFALARAGLAVESEYNKGGTWSGATEQLKRLKFVPMFVRATGTPSRGLDELKRLGAREWPDPVDSDAIHAIFKKIRSGVFEADRPNVAPQSLTVSPRQAAMVMDPGETFESDTGESATDQIQIDPSDALFSDIRPHILAALRESKSRDEVARELGVLKKQMDSWLSRLVNEGAVTKHKRPVRYIANE